MDKIIVVTGGTSGIGLAVAQRFLQAGDIVIVGSVDSKETVKHALDTLTSIGSAEYRFLDVSSEESCKQMVEYVIEKYGKIDVLVNVAGVRGKVLSPLSSDFKDIEKTFKINALGTMMMGVYAAKHMIKQGFGAIINIGSISGELVTAKDFGYHCSKAAVAMSTKILAKEVSLYGVRCVTISPGGVKAGMNSSEWEIDGVKQHIRNRLVDAKEIAGAVYLMSLDEASAINGSTIMADDGYCTFKGVF